MLLQLLGLGIGEEVLELINSDPHLTQPARGQQIAYSSCLAVSTAHGTASLVITRP